MTSPTPPTATIYAFPRRPTQTATADAEAAQRLRRAMQVLDQALAAQRAAVADWRASLADLRRTMAGLGGSLHGFQTALGELDAPLLVLAQQARRLEAWADSV